MELESRKSEVLNLSLEEREVGISNSEGLKKKKGLAFKRIKGWIWASFFGLYGGDMARNHFLFNSILKLGKNLVKVF